MFGKIWDRDPLPYCPTTTHSVRRKGITLKKLQEVEVEEFIATLTLSDLAILVTLNAVVTSSSCRLEWMYMMTLFGPMEYGSPKSRIQLEICSLHWLFTTVPFEPDRRRGNVAFVSRSRFRL